MAWKMDVILLLHLYSICTFPTWLLRMRINSIFPLSRLLLQKIEIYLCIRNYSLPFSFLPLKTILNNRKNCNKDEFYCLQHLFKDAIYNLDAESWPQFHAFKRNNELAFNSHEKQTQRLHCNFIIQGYKGSSKG